MNIPEDLHYTEEHEWARVDEDQQIATIGITEFAQSELGDIVFLELPAAGDQVKAGKSVGTIEAVKTVADIYTPVSGEVVEVNDRLEDAPELINEEPYQEGWIIKVKMEDISDLKDLLSAADYKRLVE